MRISHFGYLTSSRRTNSQPDTTADFGCSTVGSTLDSGFAAICLFSEIAARFRATVLTVKSLA